MMHEIPMTGHLLAAFALTYTIGFERNLRGAAAGDRTFSLIGVGAALVAVLAQNGAPNALTGVITGVGFIGGGLTFRESRANGEVVRGITTAATIFAAAAIGAAAGEGLLLFACTGTLLTLLSLEIRHIPGLRLLDGRRWARPYAEDEDLDDDCSPAALDPADEQLLDEAARTEASRAEAARTEGRAVAAARP
ncbi:MgtC/SapB family protein [Kitasatospora sp. NBC_01250]|uniref:MgtC/SapB family protein n=1 Tax=Kitasatospora sp. NBC_01250 TaxID=2903571 RepID=UPI002E2F3141|nr:MgtC/SapB family protein [Kitasatospora sp. NBC_01250]